MIVILLNKFKKETAVNQSKMWDALKDHKSQVLELINELKEEH